MGADKKRLVTPRRGIRMPQGPGRKKKKKRKLCAWAALILFFLLASVNKGYTFDGRRQAAAERGGWSSPVARQLSAPRSPHSRRLLHVLWDTSKPRTSAR